MMINKICITSRSTPTASRRVNSSLDFIWRCSLVTKLHMEAQFNRAHISKRDFEEAESYLRSYQSSLSEPVRKAILVAAVVAYARPFTANDPGHNKESTPMLPVKIQKLLTPSEWEIHKRLITLRHEAIAHSAYARRPARRIEGIESGFMVRSKSFDILSEELNLDLFLTLCTKLHSHCLDLLCNLNRTLYSGVLKPILPARQNFQKKR